MKSLSKKFTTQKHNNSEVENYISISMEFENELLRSNTGQNSFLDKWIKGESEKRRTFFYSQIEKHQKKKKSEVPD